MVNRPVRQALALSTFESICRLFPIGDAKARMIVVAEIKLLQMSLKAFAAFSSS